MTVLRIHKKQQNFVILDKTCLNDASLSWGAKGLHAYLISLPDDWKVQVSDLKERAKNGRDAVRGFLCELEQVGYIQKSTTRDNTSGRFGGIEYLVFEVPVPKNQHYAPETEKPSSVKNEQKTPRPGNPSPENPTLINNNYINNNNIKSDAKTLGNKNTPKTVSQDFYPSQETIAKAIASGHHNATDTHIIQEFIDKNTAWGSTFADFNPVYLSFLARHAEREAMRATTPPNPITRSSNNERTPHKIHSIEEALETVRKHNPNARAPSESDLPPSPEVIEFDYDESHLMAMDGINQDLRTIVSY
ncbi:hypothetical protein [Legionella lytica]|uniref:hypothetical protein n=1 Tax=Legionella lytica TaxID=96232 RepID=UPI00208F3605|nr:hypothetical protein [Legionella lytica]